MNSIPSILASPTKRVALLKLMRPRQWVKNLFVLTPLLFTGEFIHLDSSLRVFYAMLLFCLASSAVYIVNDLHDMERDRQHPLKALTRPLAAGLLSRQDAWVLLGILYAALALGAFIIPKVGLVLLAYILINLAYSLILKHEPVLDIFTIATGFVLRVYAGAMALDATVSAWMFVTTLCLALYLAAVKRRQELAQSGTEGRKVLERYSIQLVEHYAEISAIGTLVFYSLFVMSEQPDMVMTIPIVLFGLFRYWYVVEMLEGGESPTDALLDDRQLQLVVILWVSVCAWALWPN